MPSSRQPQGSIITADDVIEGAAGLVSVFIEQPQFQGQTKEKLVSVEATKLVETIVGDNFEHWLTGDKEAGNVLLEHVIAKAEERLRRSRTASSSARPRPASSASRQARRLLQLLARKAPRSSWSRAIRPAARPRRRATARPRRSCRCAARS
jgi:DNA gyrase/topoisomerase IV subunit B